VTRRAVVVSVFIVSVSQVGLAQRQSIDGIAEQYVRLVLALGVHDADYVDAYYGPPAWRTAIEESRPSIRSISTQAEVIARQLALISVPSGEDDPIHLRHAYLTRQIGALRARADMRSGRKMTFDEESKALYDAVAPVNAEGEFEAVLQQLAAHLPGTGPLRERFESFRQRFVIPRDRLEATFRAAIDGCRERTLRHIALPQDESFSVEYVTNQTWSAYNWYQGSYRSVIQVNTDLPIPVDGAVDLACHEGYPGHHVYNVLLERNLVRGRKWVEFSVYPLFSPQSLIAEGTANFGIEVTFPRADRLQFEREVVFPAAGLDPSTAEEYYALLALTDRLSYSGNEAARRYLDGTLSTTEAVEWLERYALMSRSRAEQRMRFIDQYRSYVINYNLGKDMVGDYIRRRVGGTSDVERTWREFERLLSSPRLPSGLLAR
jgi:hypothetical protein